jgi:hypothetical protein
MQSKDREAACGAGAASGRSLDPVLCKQNSLKRLWMSTRRGILRLRVSFASPRSHSAQDDRSFFLKADTSLTWQFPPLRLLPPVVKVLSDPCASVALISFPVFLRFPQQSVILHSFCTNGPQFSLEGAEPVEAHCLHASANVERVLPGHREASAGPRQFSRVNCWEDSRVAERRTGLPGRCGLLRKSASQEAGLSCGSS